MAAVPQIPAARCFDCKALARANVIENPSLELNVYLGTNFGGDFPERAQVQFGCAVICVEPINVKRGEWKTAAFPAAGRACDNGHARTRTV